MTAILDRVRSRHLLVLDALSILVAYWFAFAIRFDYTRLWEQFSLHWTLIPVALLIKLPIFYTLGLYRRLWRYASVGELQSILVAVSLSSLALTVLVLTVLLLPGIPWLEGFPRGVLAIDWLMTVLLIGGSRFTLRILGERERRPAPAARAGRRMLIAGAGKAGAMLVREIRRNPHLGMEPIGFLDDDPAKQKLHIQGVPVLGTLDDLFVVVKRQRVDEVLIAIPSAPGRVIRRIVLACEEAGVSFKTIPGVYELMGGQVHVRQMREVRIEDLLRRESVQINIREIAEYLTTATVLVTGAGGSIGSELSRKIAAFQPRHLLLLGRGENSIYHIEQELSRSHPHVKTTPIICDIKDATKIDHIMRRYQPQVVFHAAAHKHVPLMECHLEEVVTNNIIGTRVVAEAAHRHGVHRFVLISTDKTVNPASAYGASKRIAEMVVQDLATRSATTFVTVRFGNVLGSQGSVVPTFQEQIAAGGPVTIAHPEVTRYFMTIPEAAQLVIQAGAMGRGGEIFVLDMGEPVSILELARDLIRLSGLEVGHDIDITFVGLRPGDKLHEEVFAESEQPAPTDHEKILIIRPGTVNGATLASDIDELARLAAALDEVGIRAKFRAMLPTYHEATEAPLPAAATAD